MIRSFQLPGLRQLGALGMMSLLTLGHTACSGCGGDSNNLQVQDEPAMRIETPASGAVELDVPTRERTPIELSEIVILSSGEVPLQIQAIEWVDKPDRVFMGGGRIENVDESNCDSEIYYPASRVCVLTEPPDFSAPIPANTAFAIQLHVSSYDVGEPNVITCPDVPADVPEQFKDRYCGAIRIKSDARNDSGPVVEGEAMIYLQADRSSGQVMLTVPSLTFENVVPGFVESQSFGIVNAGTTPLTIEGVLPRDYGQYLDVSGPELPLEIAPGDSEQFNVKLDIPTSTDPEDLKFSTEIRIDTSAPTPTLLQINVDNSRQIPPVPQLDREQIAFAGDGDVQELRVTNMGTVPISIGNVSFEPSEARNYYELLDENEQAFTPPVVIQSPSASNPDRNKKAFKIKYTKPANMKLGLASMILNYTYFVGSIAQTGSVRVTLLGDKAMVAFLDVVPSVFSFSTQETAKQVRTAAFYNLGTAPVTVNKIDLNSLISGQDTGEFNIALQGASFPVTIPAGAIQMMEVSFVGTNSDVDQIDGLVDSDAENDEQPRITLSSLDVPLAQPELDFTSSFAFEVMTDEATRLTHFLMPAPVGELASVEFAASVETSIANNAQWVILKRPASSDLYVKTNGAKVGLVFDVAGTYELLVTSSQGGLDVQQIIRIDAQ